MGRTKWAVWLLVAMAMLTICCPIAQAEMDLAAEPSIAASIGYDGAIAYMHAMPLHVTVSGGSRGAKGVVAVDIYRDSREYDRYEHSVDVAAHAVWEIVIPLKLAMRQPQYLVQLIGADGEMIDEVSTKPARELGAQSLLVGTLSPDPASLSYMSRGNKPAFSYAANSWSLIPLSEKNFPRDQQMFTAFGLIFVDGFDVRTLDQAQQDAFRGWIEQGGIAVVGGGANASIGYPFFESMTGIRPGTLTEANDVLSGLYRCLLENDATHQFAAREIPLEPMMINEVSGGMAMADGVHPLLRRTSVGAGYVLTAAFELGAKALGQWDYAESIWYDLMQSESSVAGVYQMLVSRHEDLASGYSNYNEMYQLDWLSQSMEILNPNSAMVVLAALIAYLLLAGLVSYLILKKMDRRELMWLSVPLLAIGFAFLVRGLGARLQFDRPLASVISYIRYDTQGNMSPTVIGAFTTRSKERVELSVPSTFGERVMPHEMGNYYWEEASSLQKVPTAQKYTYRFGAEPACEYPNNRAWTVNIFEVMNPKLAPSSIKARAWMEADGLHAEVTNDSGYTLTRGVLISDMGFDRMDDLAPSDSGTALLKLPKDGNILAEPDQSAQQPFVEEAMASAIPTPTPTLAPPVPVPAEEVMTANVMRGYWEHEYLQAIAHPDAYYDDKRNLAWDEMNLDSDFLVDVLSMVGSMMDRNAQMSQSQGDVAAPRLRYVALTEGIASPPISAMGTAIERTVNKGIVDVAVEFEPIGKTGEVWYLPGMLNAKHMVQSNGKEEWQWMDWGTQLNAQLDMMYEIPNVEQIETDLIELSVMVDGTSAKLALYNFETNEWDEQAMLFVRLKDAEAQKYLPGNTLRLRVYPSDGSSRNGGYVQTPTITLKGRVK